MKPISKKRCNFTSSDMQFMLNKMVLQAIHSIILYPSHSGFNIKKLHTITNIDDTPTSFQERFFLCMDIIAPSIEYARQFIKREHPEVLYLFNWLCKLYCDECEINSSISIDKNVE